MFNLNIEMWESDNYVKMLAYGTGLRGTLFK